MDNFAKKYAAKYEKAVSCLTRDRKPCWHSTAFRQITGINLRTGNPIESRFATVTARNRAEASRAVAENGELMVFKVVQAAAKTWRRLSGAEPVPMVIEGVHFHRRCRYQWTLRNSRADLIKPHHQNEPSSGLQGVVCYLNEAPILELGIKTRSHTPERT